MDSFANPLFKSYTKKQLRYLVIDPNYDLSNLERPLPPTDIVPMSHKVFHSNIMLMIKKKKLKMTIIEFSDCRYLRQSLPAARCQEILIHQLGIEV